MTRTRRLGAIPQHSIRIALLVAAAPASAAVPTWSAIELQARSNFVSNGGGFNLPGDVFFTNGTPALNDDGRVAIRLSLIAATDRQGIWLGAGGTGTTVYQTPVGGGCSDPSLSNLGLIVFEQSFTSPDGLFFHDDADGSSGLLTDQPIGASGWGSPTVNTAGEVGYRASFLGDHAYYSWNGVSATLYAAEADLVATSPYSFLFTPDSDDGGRIAAKVRLGPAGQVANSRPDEIRLFTATGSTLIAEDQDSNPSSPFTSFDNGVSVNDAGQVAFVASLAAGGRGVFLSDGVTTLEIATTNDPALSDIEFFRPAANDNGLVAFRGKDGGGLQAIFVGDGTDLEVVVRKLDELATDLGIARIAQNDASPVFGGSPAINAAGDVAFQCALTPTGNDQIEWGSGLFIASADAAFCPTDFTQDGTIGLADLTLLLNSWGPCPAPCPFDLTEDGTVGLADLTLLLNAWGPCTL